MKKSGLEWLKPQIELMLMDGHKSYPNELEEVFEIAKEMEKHQQGYSEEEAGELVYNIIGKYAKQYGIMVDGAKLNDLFEQFKKK
jgi:NTP pyrophosphatase (non-canonical NTP hydrolase)